MLQTRPGAAGERSTRPQTIPAFEALAETLARLGAGPAFGLLGSGNFRLVERLTSRHGVAHHWARHETGAVVMADAWARVTGRVGLCTVHQGPGLTNAMTGLAEAAKARTPLVLVAGEVATTAAAVNQRIDQDGLARAAGAGGADAGCPLLPGRRPGRGLPCAPGRVGARPPGAGRAVRGCDRRRRG